MRPRAFVQSCVAITFAAQCALAAAPQSPDARQTFAGAKTLWNGFDRYDFKLDGQRCILVTPESAAQGKPWIWRARFFGHEPQADLALLAKGYHLAYTDVAGLYGSPRAVARWDRFYRYLTQEHGLARKVVLEGMSRGGLIVFNWAARNPDQVACIYVDAPVCDFKSWPGGKGRGTGSAASWAECLKAYGLTEKEAHTYAGNPVDNLEPLAAAGIPLLHVCGDADKVVPIEENTRVVERRYKKLGGSITVIAKPGVGHHPHSLKDPRPIADFVLRHSGAQRALYAGPWDLTELARPPRMTWADESGDVRSLHYAGEPYRGKPTRVWAVYGTPDTARAGAKVPAMVLVHGGGGTAFPEWVELWRKRGYAAIAMDLAGKDAEKRRLPDGGPDQEHQQKFDDLTGGVKNAWTYHAVANVIRAVSLLRTMPEVDADRIGVTGISWGGYLTCIVAGLDTRLKVAVPVYGCGFLHENSTWLGDFERLGPEATGLWVRNFDPSRYLAGATMPMLFVNGTNDFAYPLDSYKKSYHLVRSPRTLCVTVRMPHGHPQGWAPKEIGLFVDSSLRAGPPLPKIGRALRDGRTVRAPVDSEVPVREAALHYTADEGPWQKRNWKTIPADVREDRVQATLPPDARLTYFLTITDTRGATVSTEHEVVEQ